tara:strand:- start:1316 stop:1900 length:585 start_codon:yes stop_codon:yes gene_type:complete
MNLFQQHKYLIVRNAISIELANFAFNYFLMKRDATEWMHKNNYVSEFTPGFGTWKDEQVPNTYSVYGDTFMETLMMKVLPVMKQHTDLDVIPTYSYTRAYKKGDILKKHKDRPSCEISTTLHLGGNPWSIYVEGIKIDLNVGDMLIYSGCELEHWREPFEGSVCVQTFLHYNNANGQYAHTNKFDKRPMLGIPK